jgi:UDP-glucose 4-epimerase
MNVLITGGLGAIGAYVVRELLNRELKPIVFDISSDTSLIKDVVNRVTIVNSDILDLPSLISAVRDHSVSRIIHLAATIEGIEKQKMNVPRVIDIAVKGTINVLEAARCLGLERVVYASSRAAYGEAGKEYGHPNYKPLPVDYPLSPDTIYGAAKLLCERIGEHYDSVAGIQFVACRFASTYGPGKLSGRHGAVSLQCRLMESAMRGEEAVIPQGGDQKNDFIYYQDIAEGLVSACLAEPLGHRVYQFGTGQGASLKDMAEILKRLFPKARIEVGEGLDYLGLGKDYYCVLDITRAREDLGYVPKYDVEKGIGDYYSTLRRLGLM